MADIYHDWHIDNNGLEQNINRMGGDLQVIHSLMNVNTCRDTCNNTTECMSFTFTNNTCWLKSEIPPRIKEEGFISGVSISHFICVHDET